MDNCEQNEYYVTYPFVDGIQSAEKNQKRHRM